MAKAKVSIPLDIPEVEVLKTETNAKGEYIITIESTKKTTICRRCGREITKLHGHDGWVTLRYLPVFGRPTYLRYRPKRYICEYCDDHPTTTQRVEWQSEQQRL